MKTFMFAALAALTLVVAQSCCSDECEPQPAPHATAMIACPACHAQVSATAMVTHCSACNAYVSAGPSMVCPKCHHDLHGEASVCGSCAHAH